MSAKVTEFKLGKGISAAAGKDGPWTKKYFELTVKLPEQQISEEDFAAALVRAEYVIDNFLGQPPAVAASTPQIPEFDPQILMTHEWKGKKTGEGQYEKGSVAWGWDFQDKFPPEVIKILDKGPLEIDKYEFSLAGTIVQTKEKKEGKKGRR
jgi:hypothetical protein